MQQNRLIFRGKKCFRSILTNQRVQVISDRFLQEINFALVFVCVEVRPLGIPFPNGKAEKAKQKLLSEQRINPNPTLGSKLNWLVGSRSYALKMRP